MTVGPRTGTVAMRRRIVALGVAIISAAAMFTVTAARASADYEARYQSTGSGQRCLGYGGGDRVIVYGNSAVGCAAVPGGVWNVHLWRDRTSQMRVGDRCLDDSLQYGVRAFAPCWPGSSPLSRYQSWFRTYIRRDSAGEIYTFRNQATGRCLDFSYAFGVRTVACNGLFYQEWRELF